MTPTRVLMALSRAWACTTKKAKYKLGAGGRDPIAPTPFTVRDGVLGADCVGFVLWCLELDRFQPKLFRYFDGWMNTDSIILDAQSPLSPLWEEVQRPRVGDLVVYPSIRKNGKMTRMGHVGIIVDVPVFWAGDDRRALLKAVRVIDCNASKLRRLRGKAVAVTTAAALWNKPDAIFVRYVGP